MTDGNAMAALPAGAYTEPVDVTAGAPVTPVTAAAAATELPDAVTPLGGDVTVMAKADGTTSFMPGAGAAVAKETGSVNSR